MAISYYLEKLISLRDSLKTTLTEKGIDTENKNTLDDLIPMIENVSAGNAPEITAEPIEKMLYRFGVLSDIHLKDANFGVDEESMYDTADSLNDYARALTFFKSNGVDFVCIDGDIVANNWTSATAEEGNATGEWVAELQLFRQYNDAYMPDTPIYATSGNHDANIWGYTHAANGMGQLVSVYGDGTKKAEQVWEEIVGSPLRFKFEQGEDVFLFLPMYYWHYTQLLRKADLTWLTEELETNKTKRVFLFFHPTLGQTYDDDADGIPADVGTSYSNSYNAPAIRELIFKYPNVIWFTGHSHYDLWREGGVQPDGVTPYVNPNTYQTGDSMTMVHCPSCAYIRGRNASGNTIREYAGSQGLMVDVFADRVVVKGIDFTQGNGGAFIPKATYVINAK